MIKNEITKETFKINGFVEITSNSTNSTFLCNCSYEKTHSISINNQTNKFQSFNPNCEQKQNPREFTRKYLSRNYQNHNESYIKESIIKNNKIIEIDSKKEKLNNIELLNNLYNFIKNKIENEYKENYDNYKLRFFEERALQLPQDSLIYKKEIIEEFLKTLSKKDIKDLDFINFTYKGKPNNRLEHYLINFVRNENNLVYSFEVHLLKQLYYENKKYFDDIHKNNEKYKQEGFKTIKRLNAKGLESPVSGAECLGDKNYKDGPLFLVESFLKMQSIEQIGKRNVHAIGICGINNHSQIINLSNRIKEKNLEVIIQFDKRSSLNSPEIQAAISLAEKLKKEKVKVRIAELPTPKLNEPDIDLDDYFKQFNNSKDKRKFLKKLINKSVSPGKFINEKKPEPKDDLSKLFKEKNRIRYRKANNDIKPFSSNILYNINETRENLLPIYYTDSYYASLDSENKMNLIATGGGSGKTYILFKTFDEKLDNKIKLYTAPTKELLASTKKTLEELNISYKEIKTKIDYCLENHIANKHRLSISDFNNNDNKNETNTYKTFKKTAKMNVMINKNYSIKDNDICFSCKIKQSCKKESKIQKEKNTNVYLTTLDRLIVDHQNLFEALTPDILVIDESIMSKLIIEQEFKITELEYLLNSIYTEEFFGEETNKSKEIRESLEFIIKTLKDLEKTKIKEIGDKSLYKFMTHNQPDYLKEISKLKISTFDNLKLKEGILYTNMPINGLIPNIIRSFKDKFKNLSMKVDKLGASFTLKFKRDFSFISKLNCIQYHLDATADRKLNEKVLGITYNTVFEPDILHKNLEIYQDNSRTYSVSSFQNSNKNGENKNEMKLIKLIDNELNNNRKVVVSLPKKLKEQLLLKYPKYQENINVGFINYSNVRGYNKFKDFDSIICLSPSLPINEIKNQCKIIFNQESEIKNEYKKSSIKKDDYYIDSKEICFTNKNYQSYYETKTKHEIYQAVKRIYRDYEPENIKRVYLLTNLNMSKYFSTEIKPINDFINLSKNKVDESYLNLKEVVKKSIETLGYFHQDFLLTQDKNSNVKKFVIFKDFDISNLESIGNISFGNFINNNISKKFLNYTEASNNNDFNFIDEKKIREYLKTISTELLISSKKISLLDNGVWKTYNFYINDESIVNKIKDTFSSINKQNDIKTSTEVFSSLAEEGILNTKIFNYYKSNPNSINKLLGINKDFNLIKSILFDKSISSDMSKEFSELLVLYKMSDNDFLYENDINYYNHKFKFYSFSNNILDDLNLKYHKKKRNLSPEIRSKSPILKDIFGYIYSTSERYKDTFVIQSYYGRITNV